MSHKSERQLEAERARGLEAARQAKEERELREQEAARNEQLMAFSAQTRKHAKARLHSCPTARFLSRPLSPAWLPFCSIVLLFCSRLTGTGEG